VKDGEIILGDFDLMRAAGRGEGLLLLRIFTEEGL